ncbi:hypothetical protein F5I97DRAFT_860252 [Phlebopus sp. FC_14]|nr:hypothetical protein F5I97DRAFT_860252 [Phlebopus sp. FC_14]
MIFDAVSRAAARRLEPSLQVVARRFKSVQSSLDSDRAQLQRIINEEANKEETGSEATSWQMQNTRRKFAAGLFIRPHYWSYEHRFEAQRPFISNPLVAPGIRESAEKDILLHFDIDPIWESSNPTLLSSFVTDLGKIKPRTQTRLSAKTQRRLAKAIRRAKMMGVIPILSNPRLSPKHK